ncbi:MAG: hypothetical protein ACREBG_13265, partial [Pyrinomonadaceae bacterium]
ELIRRLARYVCQEQRTHGPHCGACRDIAVRLAPLADVVEAAQDTLTNWFDEHYPAEVFTSESGDEGARLREKLRMALSKLEELP